LVHAIETTYFGGNTTELDPTDVCIDSDNDGRPDAIDNCPFLKNTDQADADGDGVGDKCDNCINTYNPKQFDSEGREIVIGASSPAPALEMTWNFFQHHAVASQLLEKRDSSGERPDGIGDACDVCPNHYNPNQTDTDGDSIGDICDRCPDQFDPLQDTDSTYACEDIELIYQCPEYVSLCVGSLLEAESTCADGLEAQCLVDESSSVWHGSFELTPTACKFCTDCTGTCDDQTVEVTDVCLETPWEGKELTAEQAAGCTHNLGI